MNQAFTVYNERRNVLIASIKEIHPDKKGIVALFSGFEGERYAFRQESTFYYFTGLVEPACSLTIDLEGTAV